VTSRTRPLNEAEAVELRLAAETTDRPTRHAAAAALALAGGFSGEIGHIRSTLRRRCRVDSEAAAVRP
jgi:hypothetical protein